MYSDGGLWSSSLAHVLCSVGTSIYIIIGTFHKRYTPSCRDAAALGEHGFYGRQWTVKLCGGGGGIMWGGVVECRYSPAGPCVCFLFRPRGTNATQTTLSIIHTHMHTLHMPSLSGILPSGISNCLRAILRGVTFSPSPSKEAGVTLRLEREQHTIHTQ